MTDSRRLGRHSTAAMAAPQMPEGVAPDEVWVPPPYEPSRPGDFIEYTSVNFEVKRSHRGLKRVLAALLVIALASGGWWWHERSLADPVDPVQACAQENAGAEAASSSTVHVTVGGHLPKGVPMPSEPVWVQCHASAEGGSSLETAAWQSSSQSDYEALLSAAGWVPAPGPDGFTIWLNGVDHRKIWTGTVDSHLVAFYLD